MKLFEIKKEDEDEYQKNAFSIMLMSSITMCLILSLASIVLSTECLRDRTASCFAGSLRQDRKTKQTDVVPTEFSNNSLLNREARGSATRPFIPPPPTHSVDNDV